MKKDRLEKRQARYKVGCVVEFTHRLPYWKFYGEDSKSKAVVISSEGDISGRYMNKKYWVKVRILNNPKKTGWVRKSAHIRLVSKNTAIMESL